MRPATGSFPKSVFAGGVRSDPSAHARTCTRLCGEPVVGGAPGSYDPDLQIKKTVIIWNAAMPRLLMTTGFWRVPTVNGVRIL